MFFTKNYTKGLEMKHYTIKNIMDLYKVKKTRNSIIYDEDKGLIPKADRIKRGSAEIRAWSENQLPDVGKIYGFLNSPEKTKIITIYSPKGGVLKSTLSFNIARILALNGIKILAIGIEVSQKSLTKAVLPQHEVHSIKDIEENPEYGLWEVARKEKHIKDVIKVCDLKSLHCIPETANLGLLDEYIEKATLREFFLQRMLEPVIKDYDVILFDNSSYYRSHLVKNALSMATDVICPLGCEVGAFQSVLEGIELINNFKRDMNLQWEHFYFVPTLRDNRRLSSEIETFYRSNLGRSVTTSTIHAYKAIAEESIVEQLSVIEYSSKSPLADDYYNLLTELYGKTV